MALLAKYSIMALILTNILFVISFLAGKFIYTKNKPESLKSSFTVYIGFLFGFYLIFLATTIILGLFTRIAEYAALFTLFLIIPFVIGKFASYEKLNFYTNIQITVLIISLISGLFLYVRI